MKRAASGDQGYAYFGGVPIAEGHFDGSWEDYVYANGRRVARLDSGTTVSIRFTNDSCSSCLGQATGGGDRNLYVTSVVIDGATIPLNATGTSYADTILTCPRKAQPV
jgi:hypothetical protein